jgi:disulfide bond formation protein DsbB
MAIPSRRLVNFAGFLLCVAMMSYALYAEHLLLLDPCPLCILQRVAVIALGVVFLLAALHNPTASGRYVYGGLVGLAAFGGVLVAGRHVWLQQLPPDRVPACGPGLDYMLDNFPFQQVIDMVFTGSGECASSDWSLLGLTMPAWVLLAVIGMGSAGVANNLRK